MISDIQSDEYSGFKQLLFHLHDSVVIFKDDSGDILDANRAFREKFTDNESDFYNIVEFLPYINFPLEKNEGDEVVVIESHACGKDKETFPVKIRISRNDGDRCIAIIHDLSDYSSTKNNLKDDMWIFSRIDEFKKRLPRGDFNEIIQYSLSFLNELFDIVLISYFLTETSQEILYLKSSHQNKSLCPIGRASESGRCRHIRDMGNQLDILREFKCMEVPCETENFFKHPLSHINEEIGYIQVANMDSTPVLTREKHLLNLISSLLIVILENASLFQELKNKELRFRTLIEFAPDAICLVDFDSKRFVEVNEKALRMLDTSQDFLLKNPFGSFSAETEERFNEVKAKLEDLIRTKSSQEILLEQWRLKKQGGEIITCEIRIVYFPEKGQNYFRISLLDITEKLAVRNKIREQQDQIMRSENLASLGRMAAGMAHEITQPLMGISMDVESILLDRNDGLSDEETETLKLEQIHGHVDRINNLVHNIRLFSRGSSEKVGADFSIEKVLDRVLNLMKVQIRKEDVNITSQIESPLPQLIGNSYKIEQVFINLLTNAIYSVSESGKEEKEIQIRIFPVDDQICIDVKDWGTGIDEKTKEQIFDPFFTTKDEKNGTGLGLSICHTIVQEFGGRIACESEVGEFCLFRIELPVGSRR